MAGREAKTEGSRRRLPPRSNLGEWRRAAAQRFRDQGFESPASEADAIAGHALGLARSDLVLERERMLEPSERRRLSRLLYLRLRHVPLQYVLGKVDFAGIPLEVRRGIFIPRPETEGLVERTLALLDPGTGGTVADVGTGTGAIAIAVASACPLLDVVAVDISPRAASLARRNVRKHGVQDRVTVLEGDLLDPVTAPEFLDAVISNPPYIAERDRGLLAPEVVDHEPHLALFADGNGLSVIRKLVEQAATKLTGGGLLAMEIGEDQGEEVRGLLDRSGNWTGIGIERDLAGKDRYALARCRR